MIPSHSNSASRRIPIYVGLTLVSVFALLLVVYLLRLPRSGGAGGNEDAYLSAMNQGKALYEQGNATNAIAAFELARQLAPTDIDVHLNLANAYLLANQPDKVLAHTAEALQLDGSSAAAFYLEGCAQLRLGKAEEAVKALQQARDLSSRVSAVNFQLGKAHEKLGQWDAAITAFQSAAGLDPKHPSANYALSQALLRAGRADEAATAMAQHQQAIAGQTGPPPDVSTFERSIYTVARAPFRLEQPDKAGVPVKFVDTTSTAFGADAGKFLGPVGIMDINRRGANDLFVRTEAGFQVLWNTNGVFTPRGLPWPSAPDAQFKQVLVADLQNDRFEDVIVIGEKATQVFKFATNGTATDVTGFCGLKTVTGKSAALADLDFSGKLDLLVLQPEGAGVKMYRNLGNMFFRDNSATSGVPASVTGLQQILLDDWNHDDLLDLFATTADGVPQLWAKQRGGILVATNLPTDVPTGSAVMVGDLNNDLRNDLVVAGKGEIKVRLSGESKLLSIALGTWSAEKLLLVDYDNDGWLDLCALGEGIRVWRNAGRAGFEDRTAALGLDTLKARYDALHVADFDQDGDGDWLLTQANGALQMLRNDGGNANQQIRVRLLGNRSNSSGLGVRVEVTAGRWRTSRTVRSLPVELGVGKAAQLDSLTVRWFDLALSSVEVKVEPKTILTLAELQLPTGSCPYLYTWDGEKFRFVTDLLGAAPLGLPVAEGVYIDADPDEIVWMGNEQNMQPRDGFYTLQITEELREVLYLDDAKLLVVDRPVNTEVHPTTKLLPRGPFPAPALMALQNEHPLRRAENLSGQDVTALLQAVDGQFVSPENLRVPQLRGLAEPHGVVLDFGKLDTQRPLVLALTGWLRFGGGMANIGASHNPDLPFPFPVLEVETADGKWQPVDVVAGAPVGKTKNMVIDLTGKLPAGSQRLKLTAAFEIHWDRIALLERANDAEVRVTRLAADATDLHWRGFSEFEDLSWQHPLTPDYTRVRQDAHWRITPSGWCTRYGAVDELLQGKDNSLVLINGGDELTLKFAANKLPPKPAGTVREFFLYVVGWDKDADFHVAQGYRVEPLPWHGMNDQLYGKEERPAFANDDWIERYNTRWVGPTTLSGRE